MAETEAKTLPCPKCEKSYASDNGLRYHMKHAHNIIKVTKKGVRGAVAGKLLHCDHCKFSTRYPTVLGNHKKWRHGIAGKNRTAVTKQIEQGVNANGNGASPITTTEGEIQIDRFLLGHSLGTIQGFLANIAEQEGVPVEALTAGVVALLRPAPVRQRRGVLRAL